jgi:hypothetical protein
LTKQLDFWKDLATLELGDDTATTEVYARFLTQRIKTETKALKSRALWQQYCGHLSENGQ